MTEKMEKLIKQAEKVNCGGYDLRYAELTELIELYRNDLSEGSFMFFRIGFLKGIRAEKARQKKKRQSVGC